MKRITFILVAVFAVLIISGCHKHVEYKTPYTDLRFDKDTVDLVITPESEEFSIGFHKSNDTMPENFVLREITNVDVLIKITTSDPVDPDAQFFFPGSVTDRPDAYMDVNYDNSGTKGSIKLKVNPQKITEPVQIILRALAFPNPIVTINLIPQAQ